MLSKKEEFRVFWKAPDAMCNNECVRSVAYALSKKEEIATYATVKIQRFTAEALDDSHIRGVTKASYEGQSTQIRVQ